MTLPLTGAVAAVFSLVLVALAVPVVVLRAQHEVSFGDGAVVGLTRAIRSHAHFAEYAPLFLLELGLLELQGTSVSWILGLAACFGAGRLLYTAYFFAWPVLGLRIAGFWATVGPMAVGAALLLFY